MAAEEVGEEAVGLWRTMLAPLLRTWGVAQPFFRFDALVAEGSDLTERPVSV